MQDQAVATITYNRTQVTPTTIVTEYRRSSDAVNGNRQKIEQYMGLDTSAVAQVSTATITLGAANDDYVVAVTSENNTKFYRHRQIAGDTAEYIAECLATIINTHPAVATKTEGNVITMTAAIAGLPFTADSTGTTTPANATIATTTPSAGTPKHRKRWEAFINFGVTAQGFEQLTAQGVCYNGAEPPVQAIAFGPIVIATSPVALSQVQANNA